MSAAIDEFDEFVTVERFLSAIRTGVGPLNAAYSVDWTPADLRKRMRQPDFAELVAVAKERRIESIEETLYALANRGNVRAIETVLFCQAPERGWKPPAQRIDVAKTHKVEVSIVNATVEAARQLLAESTPAALQPGGALDYIEADSRSDEE